MISTLSIVSKETIRTNPSRYHSSGLFSVIIRYLGGWSKQVFRSSLLQS
jgi:hypothetical protein